MRITLVRPPFYSMFGVTAPRMKTYPLNLLYLATYARNVGGHEVAIVDGEAVTCPGMEDAALREADPGNAVHKGIAGMLGILHDQGHALWEEMECRILAHAPELVGITCNSGNMDTVRMLVARLGRHKLPIILGGSHPTALPEQSLRYTGADLVAVGEGEQTLSRVAETLQGNGALEAVPSLAYFRNGELTINPRGDLIQPIDSLPIPDRSFVDRNEYFGDAIMTGRGCPFDCVYCASRNIWGKRVRLRSVESILAELEIIRSDVERHLGRTGADMPRAAAPERWVVKVLDDTFTVNRSRTIALLDAIIGAGLDCFEFTGGVRADTLNETVVERMVRAGFKRVTLGVESGSPKMLKMIRKGETNADVKRAMELLRNAGIKSHAFFMIGLPGETPEDIELSKNLIREVRPDHVEINMVTPYPGTDLFPMLIGEDPLKIDRWYRWFHQGLATHSDRLGYDLDKAYEDFLDFALHYHVGDM
ncbi:MAG: radical SAM protein [Thermodesulfobacteriota bacterium]